jgi:hypothetical protein
VFTPNVAVVYKPMPQMSTYVSYAKGLEQGDPAPLGTTNQNQVLDPLDSRQIEAGVKWDVTPELNVQTAVFRIEKPLEFIDATNTWIQSGTQQHTGFELNVAGRVTPNLALFGGLTLLDAEQKSTGDPTRDGKQKSNVARVRATLFAEYAIPELPGVVVDGRWQHVARRPVTDDNSVWVGGYDVFPTLLDYAGIAHDVDSRKPGRSFAPLLAGFPEARDRDVVVYDEYGPVRMVRTREWKYVHRHPDGPHELYDLARDPGERHDLFGRPGSEGIAATLRARLDAWFARYVDPLQDGAIKPVNGCGQLALSNHGTDDAQAFAADPIAALARPATPGGL